jgi:DNA processing protein
LETPELVYQIAITQLKGIGPVKAKILISKLEKIENLFTLKIKELEKVTGINQKILFQMEREEALLKAKKQIGFIKKNNIQCHFYTDKTYPRRLKECIDAPLLLFSKGKVECNFEKIVSIVGTRNATEYGRKICDDLIKDLQGKEILVVSGMAYGIDIHVHNLCVKYNIPTIGVLGHGLDRLYPNQHAEIANKMLENGGLLTEYLPGTNPDKENFPMRNRIVAGMCDATIVIESKIKGGSLITADLANQYNKDVFAYPGNVGQEFSKGCNQLILDQKAHLLLNGKAFLKWMSWDEEKKNSENVQRTIFLNLNEDEKAIADILKESPLHIDVISSKVGIPISKINIHLFNLEMNGVLQSLPGKIYKLI